MLAVALTVGIALGVLDCDADEEGFCAKRNVVVELDTTVSTVDLRLNVALGAVATLHFPEGLRIEERNVVRGNTPLFQASVAPSTITIHTAVPEEATRKAAEQKVPVARLLQNGRGNVQITLERGWVINVDLRIWYPSLSVRTVTFVSDEIAAEERFLAKEIAAARKQIEAEYEERHGQIEKEVQRRGLTMVADQILERNECGDGDEVEMQDLLWVRHERSCLVGPHVHLHFRVRNRSRGVDFRIGSVAVYDAEGRRLEVAWAFRVEEKRTSLADVRLGMDDEVLGAAVFPEEGVATPLVLELEEAGGDNRSVRLEDLSF